MLHSDSTTAVHAVNRGAPLASSNVLLATVCCAAATALKGMTMATAVHVHSHVGHPWAEMADVAATYAREAA
eukprot:2313962-Alexandrium_andersonii.AAC.1